MTVPNEDLIALQNRVVDLEEKLAAYEINGLRDSFSGSGQQRFGGNAGRLDKNGVQFISGDAYTDEDDVTAQVYWVPSFKTNPSSEYPRVRISGLNSSSKQSSSISTLSASGGDEINAGVSRGLGFNSAYLQSIDSSGPQAYVFVETSNTKEYVLVGPAIVLSQETADPSAFTVGVAATVFDGWLWYRSDTDKFRARINGVTENLATEAYVATNGGIVKTEQMITPWSRASLGIPMGSLGVIAPTDAAWPAANDAIFIPFTLDESTTFTKAFWYNGATVSGNVDIGIYNEAGTRQVSIGSTAQATINVIQEVNIADTTLAAGRYYMALACDNTTATFFRTSAVGVELAKGVGIAKQATAFALPATATLAVPTAGYIPFFGFSIRTLVA